MRKTWIFHMSLGFDDFWKFPAMLDGAQTKGDDTGNLVPS
jgi:hypothetical protein